MNPWSSLLVLLLLTVTPRFVLCRYMTWSPHFVKYQYTETFPVVFVGYKLSIKIQSDGFFHGTEYTEWRVLYPSLTRSWLHPVPLCCVDKDWLMNLPFILCLPFILWRWFTTFCLVPEKEWTVLTLLVVSGRMIYKEHGTLFQVYPKLIALLGVHLCFPWGSLSKSW